MPMNYFNLMIKLSKMSLFLWINKKVVLKWNLLWQECEDYLGLKIFEYYVNISD